MDDDPVAGLATNCDGLNGWPNVDEQPRLSLKVRADFLPRRWAFRGGRASLVADSAWGCGAQDHVDRSTCARFQDSDCPLHDIRADSRCLSLHQYASGASTDVSHLGRNRIGDNHVG